MKYVALVARILLGLIFVVFGLNFWLKFIPMPPLPEGNPGMFMGVLFSTGYLAVVKALEVLGGLLLLVGLVPAGLLILGPIIVNILLFDIFVTRAFNPVGTAVAVLALVLVWACRDRFAALVRSRC